MPLKKRKSIGQKDPKAKKVRLQRANETPEQRDFRLCQQRKRQAESRANETTEQYEERLRVQRERRAAERAAKKAQESRKRRRQRERQATIRTGRQARRQRRRKQAAPRTAELRDTETWEQLTGMTAYDIKNETADDSSNHSSAFSETCHLKDEPDFSADIEDKESNSYQPDEALSLKETIMPTFTENQGLFEEVNTSKEDDLVTIVLSVYFPEVKNGSTSQYECLLNKTSCKSEIPSLVEGEHIQADPLRISILELIKDDLQLKAFTGISFSTLNKLIDLVLDYNKQSTNSKPSWKQKIVLTLCRLRLNLSFECLGQLFGIDRLVCIQYFSSTVHLLAVVLYGAVYWPSSDEIRNNLSESFEHFRGTRVVVYRTEILVHSLDCLNCRLMLNSHYENAAHLNILVGLAPSGKITYLSKVYGSEMTDDDIFKESDLVSKNMLEPIQDAIMIDEGFRIEKSLQILNEKSITIHKLPLGRNNIFSDYQHANTNNIMNLVRAFVNQSIQKLKIFKILEDKLTSTEIPLVDDIFTIIAGLVNVS